MKRTLIAAAAAAFALPAFADINIVDPYARASGMNAMAGAAFLSIENTGDEDDRLIGAKSTISKRVELHTHIEGDGGIMRMVEVEEGFPVPANGTHALKRGGDHVMFMGLNEKMENGKIVNVTLVFEKAGEIDVEIPVDLDRKPETMGEGMMNHGDMNNGNGAMKMGN